jgi:hypothetical protein
MRPVVFLGPTLPRDKAEALCDAEFRAPAAMGDITRAAADGVPAIVLIDGVFENGPAVWHKEILWALSKRIPVIGAASMGALRASELSGYGMLGLGQVYQAFRSGMLADDDEVAVSHGPAELGFLPLSDAMVDIRFVLKAALSDKVIEPAQEQEMVSFAKARHFKQRNLDDALGATLGSAERTAFAHWREKQPYSGAKQQDAIRVLQSLEDVKDKARALLHNVPAFVATVYLKRLAPFGYDINHSADRTS